MLVSVPFVDLQTAGWLATLFVASEWAIRIAMLAVVPFRRSPDAAKGWLLLVFFLPWPALILYWFIGRPTFPAWRQERFEKLGQVFASVRGKASKRSHLRPPELPGHLEPAAKLVQNLGNLPILGGNGVELLVDYDKTIDAIVEDIDTAKEHVHLLYYIFATDATARKVIAALVRAEQRGVKCRVLIDALGSRPWAYKLVPLLEKAGVEVHRVLPLKFIKGFRADLRNHRKVVVIDGRVGYVGSQNLVDPVFKPRIVYEELVARVTGPVVLELQAVFATDWYLETDEVLDADELFPDPQPSGGIVAQVLPSGPD